MPERRHPGYAVKAKAPGTPPAGYHPVAGVGLWEFGPLTDAAAAICAVGCATVALWPTLRDARQRPDLESRLSWSADVLGNGLCLVAVGTASVAGLLHPIFLVAAAMAMTVVLLTAPEPEPPGGRGEAVPPWAGPQPVATQLLMSR